MDFYLKMADIWSSENPNRHIVINPMVFPYDGMHNKRPIALQTGTGAPVIVDIDIGKYALLLMGKT